MTNLQREYHLSGAPKQCCLIESSKNWQTNEKWYKGTKIVEKVVEYSNKKESKWGRQSEGRGV